MRTLQGLRGAVDRDGSDRGMRDAIDAWFRREERRARQRLAARMTMWALLLAAIIVAWLLLT